MVFVHIKTESVDGEKMVRKTKKLIFKGDLYVSDATGHRLSFSLRNNVRNPRNICDLEKVPSLEGVYFANIYDKIFIKLLKAKELAEDPSYSHASEKLEDYKKTLISHDAGSSWESIEPPKIDKNGVPFKCNHKCSLHLHMFSSEDITRLYSLKNTVGLIVAHGNVDSHLSKRSIGVFLSRSGGRFWKHIAYGKHVYEIGNHGGLIVIASVEGPTNEVQYSLDFGENWETYFFSKKKILVKNILMESTNSHYRFLITGSIGDSGHGVSILLDFSSMHLRKCEGFQTPENQKSDFEFFTPKNQDFGKCFLGRKVKYIRRRASSMCWI